MNRMTEENFVSFYERNGIPAEQMKVVYRTAQRLRKYIPQEMPWEDVIQYGLLGLIKASKKFEAGKGDWNRFAGFYVYGNMMDGIFQFRGMKRYRSPRRQKLDRIQEAEWEILKSEKSWWQKTEEETAFERVEERLSLKQALEKLDPEERELMEACYFQRRNWTEYAREKYVKVERVYLMHRRILKKLRKWLEC